MWLDFIPGQHNPSDVLTKHVGGIQEYVYKNGVLCGSAPLLYEAAAVRVVLDNEKRNTFFFCCLFSYPGDVKYRGKLCFRTCRDLPLQRFL